VLRLKKDLVDTWPQLRKHKTVEADLDFWISEWRTHGTCSYPLLNNVEYFQVAIKLYYGIDGKNLLRKTNLLGGKSATKSKIVDAIEQQTKFKPQIQCATIGKQSYLLEIRLCYTATKSPQLQNCNNYRSNCLDEVFF
jgi:ribonuclease I